MCFMATLTFAGSTRVQQRLKLTFKCNLSKIVLERWTVLSYNILATCQKLYDMGQERIWSQIP